jgi:nitrate reductase assembly molybdenum cofactor insertion protein NarJ
MMTGLAAFAQLLADNRRRLRELEGRLQKNEDVWVGIIRYLRSIHLQLKRSQTVPRLTK